MAGKIEIVPLFKKIGFAFLGVACLALGATFLKEGGVGLDPFTAMNEGVSSQIGLSLGVYQLIVNIIVLIFVFFFNRSYIGIGTIINMVFAGFLIDFFSFIYEQLFEFNLTISVQLIHLIIGILLFTYGASLYMSVKMGNAPYDSVAPIITERTKLSYRTARVSQELL